MKMFVVEQQPLGVEDKFNESAHGTQHSIRHHIRDHSNQDLLDIAMFTTGTLSEGGYAFLPMSHTKAWLKCRHALIKFLSPHDIDNPFQGVVEKELMESMKGVRSQEIWGVGSSPVHPKWLVHPIQTIVIARPGRCRDK